MPYRTVTRIEKLCEQLSSHPKRHARRVAGSATEMFKDQLPDGREFLDLFEYQVQLGRRLAFLRADLVAIDNRHAHAQDLERRLRDQRERELAELRERLIQLKQNLDGYFGPGGSNRIFNEAPRIPTDPVATSQLAARVHYNLTDPDFDLPEPTQEGVVVNTRVLARSFAPATARLATTLARLAEAESETKHTQSLKDEVLAMLAKFAGQVARFFEALYAVAGHERLSARLRRSAHVRREREEEGEIDDGDDEFLDGEDTFDDSEDDDPVEGVSVEDLPVPREGRPVIPPARGGLELARLRRGCFGHLAP